MKSLAQLATIHGQGTKRCLHVGQQRPSDAQDA